MTSVAHVSAASVLPSQQPARSAGKATHSSGLGAAANTGAAGETTTTTVNADGSLSITVVNASGQIVSNSTAGASNTALAATPLGGQTPATSRPGTAAASLLNMLV